ncbi:MAG: FAD-dependent oxidoreductase [candidate division KSB1 bacterium]|nr:FAD-dependent oxidoreductase [candidate division KSB1 bacterium]MDZ7319865.1 FAD-dependent oxidoreductase [candidate division KSB1 bacterium]
MNKSNLLVFIIVALAVIGVARTTHLSGSLLNSDSKLQSSYDICVYGGNASGVIAAYAARQLGKSVILIEPSGHLGGMTASGLGATDIGNKYAITGLARDFYRRLGKHYGKLEAWTFEPHVATMVFQQYVEEASIPVMISHRIIAVNKKRARIQNITVESAVAPHRKTNRTIKARMFIDCSYEGDLMALAGVSYTVGREANCEYGETLNGVQLRDQHQFPDGISPYVIPGDSTSGLVWGVSAEPLAPAGSGDKKIQAYNYRLCLTQVDSLRVPFSRPCDYDSSRYELLRRVILDRAQKNWRQNIGELYLLIREMPNGKTDVNNKGPQSTDMIGMNHDFPEASYERRREIACAHENYIRGLLWFLATDPALPATIRQQMSAWGWCKDEFMDNDYFPYQLYVREARRLRGEYVVTEHNCTGHRMVDDGVGLAAYTMDSHNCQRLVVNGMVKNEGDVQVGGFPPYPIAYRSLTPKQSECENLLVPVCLSATHIAYGSIRMEPVFMVLGQSAALAASLAIDEHCALQKINVKKLQQILKENPRLDGTPPDILVDNDDSSRVTVEGNWQRNSVWMGQYKTSCLYLGAPVPGNHRVTFRLPIPQMGKYHIYYYCPSRPQGAKSGWQWCNALPIIISRGQDQSHQSVDLQNNENSWADLGSFLFIPEQQPYIQVVADNLEFPVAADAVLLVAEIE